MCIKISSLLFVMTLFSTAAYAAEAVNLREEPQVFSQSTVGASWMKKISEKVDETGMKHIRVKQYYGAYPVWGGEAILHIKNNQKLVNGRIFSGFDREVGLHEASEHVFTAMLQQQAIQTATQIFQKDLGHQIDISKIKVEKWVYPEEKNNHVEMHYAYRVRAENNFIFLDAIKPDVIYLKWQAKENLDDKPAPDQNPPAAADKDEPKTLESLMNNPLTKLDLISMTGLGGNERNPRVYDNENMEGHYPSIEMMRDIHSGICYSFNPSVIVLNESDSTLMSFPCKKPADEYFNGGSDERNGAYNVTNDALYLGNDVLQMYLNWMRFPLLEPEQDGTQRPLIMRIHAEGDAYDDNATWDSFSMTMVFGDGGNEFFPMVTPDVVAHELSHAFTAQNSQLEYVGQSGALNESFSDMAAKAYEAYSHNSNDVDWTVAKDAAKFGFHPLRYFINPTHDAMYYPRGISSIDNVKDFIVYDTQEGKRYMDPHLASGVFNKEFYLLSQRWGIKKTFVIMAQANRHWWTSTSDFNDAACGVKNAAKNYDMDVSAIEKDMKIVDDEMVKVGIDTTKCNS